MALLARRLRAELLDEILLFLGRCIGTKQQSDLQSFIWIDGADCARALAFAAFASRSDIRPFASSRPLVRRYQSLRWRRLDRSGSRF